MLTNSKCGITQSSNSYLTVVERKTVKDKTIIQIHSFKSEDPCRFEIQYPIKNDLIDLTADNTSESNLRTIFDNDCPIKILPESFLILMNFIGKITIEVDGTHE